MSRSDYLTWSVIFHVPVFLAWGFAVYLCVTRQRENPRGATFLGLAILLKLVSYGIYYSPMLLSEDLRRDIYSTPWAFQIVQGVYGLLGCVMWILLALAVFPRRDHPYSEYGHPFDESQL